ncbi:ferritin-like domain-containing protein [Danxiaibacter flavus]|uniref:Ferritin-like domain-containing protein n=1 Tax=Danxiaibacter flavus TaxID=3049108 RepID=A0ABV3ZL05_9BACT|nr:ferritin-like domain-containing protein [Chitinophagaceae bacterium DXS]
MKQVSSGTKQQPQSAASSVKEQSSNNERKPNGTGRIDDASNESGGTAADMQQNGKQKAGIQEKSHFEKMIVDMLQDIYWAEQHLVENLPKLQEAATTEELKDAFDDHVQQTKRHVRRLQKVFGFIGMEPKGKKCEAMAGLVKEAQVIIDETEEGSMTRDAALIIAAQKVEHYEIATYGGLVQLALTAGMDEAADLLDKTLLEEEDTDQLLTEIAESYINLEAEREDFSWEKEKENSM